MTKIMIYTFEIMISVKICLPDSGGLGAFWLALIMIHKKQLESIPHPPKGGIWKLVWHIHGIILNENLVTRGIHGPSRCVLCQIIEENHSHHFIECQFTVQVWEISLEGINEKVTLPQSWKRMFIDWVNASQGSFQHKYLLKRTWKAPQKYLC